MLRIGNVVAEELQQCHQVFLGAGWDNACREKKFLGRQLSKSHFGNFYFGWTSNPSHLADDPEPGRTGYGPEFHCRG